MIVALPGLFSYLFTGENLFLGENPGFTNRKTWFFYDKPGPSCSKLTTSLVNDSLKSTSSDTQIC